MSTEQDMTEWEQIEQLARAAADALTTLAELAADGQAREAGREG